MKEPECTMKGDRVTAMVVLELKKYLYETVNGKRKRVSIYTMMSLIK